MLSAVARRARSWEPLQTFDCEVKAKIVVLNKVCRRQRRVLNKSKRKNRRLRHRAFIRWRSRMGSSALEAKVPFGAVLRRGLLSSCFLSAGGHLGPIVIVAIRQTQFASRVWMNEWICTLVIILFISLWFFVSKWVYNSYRRSQIDVSWCIKLFEIWPRVQGHSKYLDHNNTSWN